MTELAEAVLEPTDGYDGFTETTKSTPETVACAGAISYEHSLGDQARSDLAGHIGRGDHYDDWETGDIKDAIDREAVKAMTYDLMVENGGADSEDVGSLVHSKSLKGKDDLSSALLEDYFGIEIGGPGSGLGPTMTNDVETYTDPHTGVTIPIGRGSVPHEALRFADDTDGVTREEMSEAVNQTYERGSAERREPEVRRLEKAVEPSGMLEEFSRWSDNLRTLPDAQHE